MTRSDRVVALVSCVKSKQTKPTAAQDLYSSPLFRGMRTYAEAVSDRWFILSAKHGLLEPEQVIEPYELTLNRLGKQERARWASAIADAVERLVPADTRLVVLAGAAYVADLEPLLRRRYTVDVPMRGLKLGNRLRWLREANALARSA